MHIELVIAKLVTVALGLLITYQAYRGYSTYGSEPMRYVAIGFLLITVGAVLEGVLFEVFDLSLFVAGAIQTSLVAAGMLVVLYSLYGRIPQPPDRGGES
jgi:hypothetical protein